MSELEEHHKVSASDGVKAGVVTLLEVAKQTAEELPEGRRYDVEIEISEHTDNE